MTDDEMHRLANYNAQKYEGLIHTPEKDAEMKELQRRFNAGEWKYPVRSFWQRMFE